MTVPASDLAPRIARTEGMRVVMVFTAFAVTLGGLHTILAGIGWWILSMLLCATVLGVGVGVRALLKGSGRWARVIAPVAALLAGALVVMLRFGWGTGLLGVIPNMQTIERFQKLVRDAGYSITWQTVPATADEPISFVLALGVLVLAVVAEITVFSLRLPALAGFPLAVIFLIPGFAPEGRTDGWFFGASALAYLALLVVGRRWHLVSALAVGALAVVGGLVVPGALPSTDITATTSGLGPSVSTGVNPILRLGDDLRDSDKRVVLTYSTVSGQPEYLRLVEVSDFSRRDWGPGQPDLEPQNRPVAFPRPPGLSSEISTRPEVTYVRVANFLSPWLPVPYAASKVTGLEGSWQFIPSSFTVASTTTLARAENYTVSSEEITPTPKQLLAAGTRVPPGLDRYLALPPETAAAIAETAVSVTSGESSNYQKALALQAFLRSSPFQYSESAPKTAGYDGTGVEYVAAFLKQHEGYCIHFAAAMAVMAREIGIPSRIIVGFQPGSLQSGDDNGRRKFAVTTRDLHAWPELFFNDIGWVRFEPTPGRGSVPDYANQTVAGVPPLSTADSGNSTTSGKSNGLSGPKIDNGPTTARWFTSSNPTGWIILVGALGVVIVIIFLPATLRRLRRSRRLAGVRAGRTPLVALWREVMESSEDLGFLVESTLTPRETTARLQRSRGMTAEGRDALDRLCEAVEHEGYGPPFAREATLREARETLIADTKVILACLSASAGSDTRMRAVMLPPSLVTRAKRAVTRLI